MARSGSGSANGKKSRACLFFRMLHTCLMCYLAQVFLSIFDGGCVGRWRDILLDTMSVEYHLVVSCFCSF